MSILKNLLNFKDEKHILTFLWHLTFVYGIWLEFDYAEKMCISIYLLIFLDIRSLNTVSMFK